MKNLDFFYFISGIDNGIPFTAKFTFSELKSNTGKHADSEMFYALQEQPEIITELEIYKPNTVSINRDDADCIALIVRVGYGRYNQTEV